MWRFWNAYATILVGIYCDSSNSLIISGDYIHMKKNAKRVIAALFSILGSVLGLYIGGYWLFVRPVYWIVIGFRGGTLTARLLLINIIKIFLATTVGGSIWCICDIIAGHFREFPTDDE